MNVLLLMAALVTGNHDPAGLSDYELLQAVEHEIEVLDRLKAEGADVDPDGKRRESLLVVAERLTEGKATTADTLVEYLRKHAPPLTAWQLAQGYLTFVNILWFAGALFTVLAVIWLFGIYLVGLILLVPGEMWEIVVYGACLVLIGAGSVHQPRFELFPVLPGCLGLVGCLGLTRYLHFRTWDSFHKSACVFLAVVWGAVAVFYGSHVIGFLAVFALLAALGFLAGHLPGVVFVGFQNETCIPQATFAAGLLLFLHVLFTVGDVAAPEIAVFREGMGFLGAFVYYLGVLIMGSKWYWWDKNGTNWAAYFPAQALVIASGVVAFYFGSVYHIGTLLGVGGTFFSLYVLEKYYELPWEGKGWAWSLLGLGGILYGLAACMKARPEYFLIGL